MAFFKDLFLGQPGRNEQVSGLSPGQMSLQNQLESAVRGPGAGGGFGSAADYYRSILANDPQALEAFMAPEMRQYREQIIPDLAEQFAGMGAGNLGSSGFRNAAVSAGTDLAERLGKLRSSLRESAASGLTSMGSYALQPYMQNVYRQQSPGILAPLISAGLTGLGTAVGGPIGGAIGNKFGDWASQLFSPSTPASPTSKPVVSTGATT